MSTRCPESQGGDNHKRGWGRQMDAKMAGEVVNKDLLVLVMESQGEGADGKGGRGGVDAEARGDMKGGHVLTALEKGGGVSLCCPGLRWKNWPHWRGQDLTGRGWQNTLVGQSLGGLTEWER